VASFVVILCNIICVDFHRKSMESDDDDAVKHYIPAKCSIETNSGGVIITYYISRNCPYNKSQYQFHIVCELCLVFQLKAE